MTIAPIKTNPSRSPVAKKTIAACALDAPYPEHNNKTSQPGSRQSPAA
jgi:hypothetical protein